jgi:hypothetical protein
MRRTNGRDYIDTRGTTGTSGRDGAPHKSLNHATTGGIKVSTNIDDGGTINI